MAIQLNWILRENIGLLSVTALYQIFLGWEVSKSLLKSTSALPFSHRFIFPIISLCLNSFIYASFPYLSFLSFMLLSIHCYLSFLSIPFLYATFYVLLPFLTFPSLPFLYATFYLLLPFHHYSIASRIYSFYLFLKGRI